MRNIVIPVDGSSYSVQAVDWTIKNVYKQNEDRLTLLHVAKLVPGAPTLVDGAFADYPVIDPTLFNGQKEIIDFQNSAKGIHDRTSSFMGSLKARLSDSGIPDEHVQTAVFPEGTMDNMTVGECIVRHVKAHNADMVVIGTRGLSAVKGQLLGLVGLGSVSDYVIHHTDCPVTVVHQSKAQVAQ